MTNAYIYRILINEEFLNFKPCFVTFERLFNIFFQGPPLVFEPSVPQFFGVICDLEDVQAKRLIMLIFNQRQ